MSLRGEKANLERLATKSSTVLGQHMLPSLSALRYPQMTLDYRFCESLTVMRIEQDSNPILVENFGSTTGPGRNDG